MHARKLTESTYRRHYTNLQLDIEDADTAWCYMHATPRPCFTPALLRDLDDMQMGISDSVRSGHLDLSYLVVASDVPGVFNLGGDLSLFQQYIETGNSDALYKYGKACIDVLYRNIIAMGLPMTTISLVQGSALGGGFEAALSSSVIVAERSAELGFPEIMFNLFPGMGAWSLLSRKVGSGLAERLITSGKLYKAEELYEMGVVDVLAEDGEGRQAVRKYIARHRKRQNGFRAIERVKRYCQALEYEELLHIVREWVHTAMMIDRKDLRMMARLVSTQNREKCVQEAPSTDQQAA